MRRSTGINTNMIKGEHIIENKESAKLKMFINAMENDGRINEGAEGSVWPEDNYKRYWGDLSGLELDPTMIKEARIEDIKEFKKHGVYKQVPINNAGM